MTLVIGHSWVRRLADLRLDQCAGFKFIGLGGATFDFMIGEVETYFSNPRHPIPQRVFVFLGSNDLDRIGSTAEVFQVTQFCEELGRVLRLHCPQANLIFSQIEDRFYKNHLENPSAIRKDFRAKSNKFNKWLNRWQGKSGVFILKGKKGFSDPQWYARDGVHLNFYGNVRLAQRLAEFH